MGSHWLAVSIVMLTLARGAETAVGVGRATSQGPVYAKQVSSGAVTLELEPEWQDSVLLVTVRAKTRSRDLASIREGRGVA